MERYWKKVNTILLLPLLLALAACMPKVEEDEVIPIVTISSHAISGSTTDMKIRIIGSCPSSTFLLRVMVDATEYSVGGPNPASYAAGSGIPTGSCSGGSFVIDYPVPNNTVSRAINFKVKARLNDGRSSVDWATRLVNYTAPTPASPGYAIGSVGSTNDSGVLTAASTITADTYSTYALGGEVAGNPNLLDDGTTVLRSGLHGVILE